MRNFLMTLGAVSALVLLGANGVMAQNDNPQEALSASKYGALTCAQFVKLGPGEREATVRRMVHSAPGRSLVAPSITPEVSSTGEVLAEDDLAAVPGTPLTAGQLIAACQASSPQSSLTEAFARSNSGPLDPGN